MIGRTPFGFPLRTAGIDVSPQRIGGACVPYTPRPFDGQYVDDRGIVEGGRPNQ